MPGKNFDRRRSSSVRSSQSRGRPSRGGSFTGWGVRTLYDLAAPNPGGSAGQECFNAIWTGIVVGSGLLCALLGLALLGPIGALLGLAGGVRLMKQ